MPGRAGSTPGIRDQVSGIGWDARARGVDAVIEAAALQDGKVDRKLGIASSLAALVTLSSGGSSGREGPAIHIGAVLASWVSERLRAPPVTARVILGCAAAAAVSASFNAPLAGALFALEVVLRHYALHAFGPIVISSGRRRWSAASILAISPSSPCPPTRLASTGNFRPS